LGTPLRQSASRRRAPYGGLAGKIKEVIAPFPFFDRKQWSYSAIFIFDFYPPFVWRVKLLIFELRRMNRRAPKTLKKQAKTAIFLLF